MNDNHIHLLLSMAAESERLDDAGAPDPRTADCIDMHRLAEIADTGAATVREYDHLQRCRLCDLRHRAFAPAPLSVPSAGKSANKRPALVRAIHQLIATGMAACFAWLLIHTWSQPPQPQSPAVPVAAAPPSREPPRYHPRRSVRVPPMASPSEGGFAVNVNYFPPVSTVDSPAVACIQPRVAQQSNLLAVLRTWDRACGCLVWRIHQWDDGATSACVEPGEPRDIPVNITDAPSVQQVLLLAMSHRTGTLPSQGEDANALLRCLNSSETPPQSSSDLSAYASVVQACLPDGVTVIPHGFVASIR